VIIAVNENLLKDQLVLRVADNGIGMDSESTHKLVDPFFTSRTTRKVGLGIPLLISAAGACNGNFNIDSRPGVGTQIQIEFQHSHIDRMPLGDLAGTFLSLLVAHPETSWFFEYVFQPIQGVENVFEFDDIPVKLTLEDISLTEPDVLAFLKETIYSGVNSIRPEFTLL
jgi:hypothetical protein